MTLEEFDRRIVHEEHQFLTMCNEAHIWDSAAGQVLPTRARAFAEALILDLSVEATTARIQSDPIGAVAVCEVIQALVGERKTRPQLAATLPSANLTPFYAMSALVLDVPTEKLEDFERMYQSMLSGDSTTEL